MIASHRALAACLTAGMFAASATGGAQAAAAIEPPQGYVAFAHVFDGDPEADGKAGYSSFDFPLVLDALPARATGTFWASTFVFHNSAGGLPPNHVGGNQGSYMGVQHMPDGTYLAMLSLWGGIESKAGAGAACLSDIEAWYTDDRPFEPEIDDLASSDPSREVDGGPFISCRVPIVLKAGVHYRLRIAEGGGGWWSGRLIDDDSGSEILIGSVSVPAEWGRLTEPAGFIEQFGPMPDGCDTIPASETTVWAATGNDGAAQSKLTVNIYGTCEANIRARYTETPVTDGLRVKVE